MINLPNILREVMRFDPVYRGRVVNRPALKAEEAANFDGFHFVEIGDGNIIAVRSPHIDLTGLREETPEEQDIWVTLAKRHGDYIVIGMG